MIPKSTKKIVIDEVILDGVRGEIKIRGLKGGFRTRPYGG
jgi:hypothetical protein